MKFTIEAHMKEEFKSILSFFSHDVIRELHDELEEILENSDARELKYPVVFSLYRWLYEKRRWVDPLLVDSYDWKPWQLKSAYFSDLYHLVSSGIFRRAFRRADVLGFLEETKDMIVDNRLPRTREQAIRRYSPGWQYAMCDELFPFGAFTTFYPWNHNPQKTITTK